MKIVDDKIYKANSFKITDYKNLMRSVLEEYGFKYENKMMKLHSDGIVIGMELQKSDYSDAFYINCGFYVPSAHSDPTVIKAVKDCDVQIRFEHKHGIEKDKTLFDIQTTGLDTFSEIVRHNMDEMVVPVMKNGIQMLYEMEPNAIYATKKELREFLGR